MPLKEVAVNVKFAGGVETKADSKSVPSTRLLALENGVFTRAISLSKRNGYEALEDAVEGSTTVVSARRLATRGDELLAFTADRCYSHETGTDQWSDAGPVYSTVATDRAAVRTGTAQTMPDHATLSGVSVYAWEDSAGGVWWTVEDATSDRVFRAATQAHASGQRPRCVPCGDKLHVYYAVPSTNQVYVIVVNPATPSAVATPAVLIEDLLGSNPVFDACITNRTGLPVAIAWAELSTTNFRVGYVDPSGVLGSPATGHPSVATIAGNIAADTPIAIAYTDDVIAVSARVGGTSTVRAFFLDDGSSGAIAQTATQDAITLAAPQRIAAVFDTVLVGTLWVCAEAAGASSSKNSTIVNSTTATTVGTARTIRSVGLASRAFVGANSAFAYFVHDTTYFNVYLALRLSDFVCAARQLAGSASGAPTRSHLPSVHVSSDFARVVLPYKERLESESNDKFGEIGVRLLTLDFDDRGSHQTAEIGAGVYMAGGCPQHYDGRLWTEQGFNVGPESITTALAGGGSMTSGGTFLYRAWYESTDAQGEVHRGPTSFGTSVTLGGADTQVTLTLPTLRVTQKTNVRICVARSLNGDTSRLFRVSSLDPTTSGAAANGYVANDATVDSVTFVDRFSDATCRAQEPLYTNGGIPSNDPSTPGNSICVAKNRLFFTDTNDPNTIRYTHEIAPGLGVEMPPENVLSCDPAGGAITGLIAGDDGVVYVLKAGAVHGFTGIGPLRNGDAPPGSGFSEVQLVTNDVGCPFPDSLVKTPDGIMFDSAKGIYRLGLDRKPQYVGAPVEAYNAQAIRAATVMPDRSQVVFLTDAGKTLLFDYLFQQWSTFTNHEGLDAVVVGGQYHYLRTDGRVWRETIGAYSDDGARIPLVLETAWIDFVGHRLGWQRFWHLHVLGTWLSAHQLGVSYQTNFDDDWTGPFWLDATGDTSSAGWITGDHANEIGVDPLTGDAYGAGAYGAGPYGGVTNDPYVWRQGLHTDGRAIRFRFEDFEKAGTAGASFELTEMTVSGGILAQVERGVPAARSK